MDEAIAPDVVQEMWTPTPCFMGLKLILLSSTSLPNCLKRKPPFPMFHHSTTRESSAYRPVKNS